MKAYLRKGRIVIFCHESEEPFAIEFLEQVCEFYEDSGVETKAMREFIASLNTPLPTIQ